MEDERDYDEELIDGVGFADPGGRSALRAATRRNPRNRPCPNCGKPNRLTPIDVAHGYQCDECAVDDGVLVATQGLFQFNMVAGKPLNRITRALWDAYTRSLLGGMMTDVTLIVRTLKGTFAGAKRDGDWFIGETADGRKVWFVPNEVGGYTAMFPEDY